MSKASQDFIDGMDAPEHCTPDEVKKANRAFKKTLGKMALQVAEWTILLDDVVEDEADLDLIQRAYELRQKISGAGRQVQEITDRATKLRQNLGRIAEVFADFKERKKKDV